VPQAARGWARPPWRCLKIRFRHSRKPKTSGHAGLQEHALANWDDTSEEDRASLLAELQAVDLAQLQKVCASLSLVPR
jgi:hypothetical protein